MILVGAVAHKEMRYLKLNELKALSNKLEVPLVEHFPLTTNGWQELYARLSELKNVEGYVIRLKDEQTLVKVKCPDYLTKHAIKSHLRTEHLIDMWFQNNQPDYNGFTKLFRETYDEEICMWALPVISTMFDGIKELNGIVNHIKKKVETVKAGNTVRKEVALIGLHNYGKTKKFSLYMHLWLGDKDINELLKGILLQNTKQIELGMFKKYKPEEDDDAA
jgi:hypothetical protein